MLQDKDLHPIMVAEFPPFEEGLDSPQITYHQYRVKEDAWGNWYGFHNDLTDDQGYDIIYKKE